MPTTTEDIPGPVLTQAQKRKAAKATKKTAADNRQLRTTNLVIAALGGEGGGVLAEWVTQAASTEGYISQSTSVPGVAQRTGATIYYIELFDEKNAPKELPIMSLFPLAGDVDIVLASEALEAARMVQRGFVTADRTVLISSDSRSFAVEEKAATTDGTADLARLLDTIRRSARRLIHYDMQRITAKHQTIISATMLGALAGSGALPFKKSTWVDCIRNSGGKGAEASLAAFNDSYERAAAAVTDTAATTAAAATSEAASPPFVLPEGTTEGGKALIGRIREEFPAALHELLYPAIVRLADYQDHIYAADYLDRLADVLPLDTADPDYRLSRETGRFLALWMCFEDIARIAQLKIRTERTAKIRAEVQAEDSQPIVVNEYLRPQVRELVSFFPPWLGQALLNSRLSQAFLRVFTGGRVVRTSNLGGFGLFYLLSLLRPLRRRSWVFREETGRIDRWLAAVRQAATADPALGLEIALCGRLIKGYSNTRERGFANLDSILNQLQQYHLSAADVATLRDAAFADDSSTALQAALPTVSQKPRKPADG